MVIPAHNADRFVGQAVASSLRQDPRPHEVVVVDDGSTDETAQLLLGFGDAIRVVRQQRRGVAEARNRGIEESTGQYVAFLDADDLWLPGKLAAQLDVIRAEGTALVGCGYIVTDENLRPRYVVPGRELSAWVHDAVALDDWGLGFPQTAIVARDVIEKVGGFSPELSTSADLEFALRVIAVNPTGCVEAPLAVYRTHAGQMHLDLARFERDMLLLYGRLEKDRNSESALDRKRAIANLHTRLVARHLATGDLAQALQHLRCVLRAAPGRLALAPIEAALRRWRYAQLARSQESLDTPDVSARYLG